MRLQNTHRDTHANNIWNEAADINLPILVLAAIRIHQLSLENDYKSLLFAHRDCCHLIKIYKALYPECKKVKSFYVSRRCFYQPSKHFIDYAKRELSGSLLIDFAFSGRSALHFNQKTGIKFEMFTVILHKVYFRIAKQQRANIKCHYLVNRLHHEDVGDLEVLNLDLHGSVIDYTDKVIRAPIEYSRKEARLSHEVTDNAVSLIQQGFHLTSLSKNLKPKKIQRIVTVIGKYIYYHPCEMHTKSRIENASNTSKELKMKKGIDYVRHKLAYHFYYGSLRRLLDKKLIQRILFDTRKLTANGDPKIRYKKRERKRIRRIVKKS